MSRLLTSCFSCLKKTEENQRHAIIIIVGLDNSGKSVLMGTLQKLIPGKTHYCINPEMITLLIDRYKVFVYDLNGDIKGQEMWPNYYNQAQGFIFVLDSSDLTRIGEAKTVLTRLMTDERVAGKPLLLMANKQDKMNALTKSDIIKYLSLEKLVNESMSTCLVESCSAINDFRIMKNHHIIEGLRWLLAKIMGDTYEKLCTVPQSPTFGFLTSRRTRIYAEQCPSERLPVKMEMHTEQHPMQYRSEGSIVQEGGTILRPQKNSSITLALDDDMKKREHSRRKRAHRHRHRAIVPSHGQTKDSDTAASHHDFHFEGTATATFADN
ncbi:ADP-ribosylation factor-like protein 13A [Ctenodactylus gundi]